MSLSFLYWFLLLCYLIFVFVIFVIIGLKLFGPPLHQ